MAGQGGVLGWVRQYLDRIGVTTGGVYTPPEGGGGGFSNPATEDLDMDGHSISNIDGLNMSSIGEPLGLAKGSDVTSLGDSPYGPGNYNEVTGSTTIVTLSAPSQAGVTKTYRFTGAPLITHAGSGEGAAIHLRGAVNWQTTAGDVLTLTYDGTVWREISRSTAASAATTFTPTGSWVNAETIYSGRYWRSGSLMTIEYHLDLGATPTSAQLYVNLPSGVTADESNMFGPFPPRGYGAIHDVDTTGQQGALICNYEKSSNRIYPYFPSNPEAVVNQTHAGNGYEIVLSVTIPVL